VNPIGGLVILLALAVLVVGIKGTQQQVIKAAKGATPTKLSGGTSSTPQTLQASYSGATPKVVNA